MLNRLSIQGRLTKDPFATAAGSATKWMFTLASDDNYTKNKTNFIQCSAWGRTGEFLSKYFHKGDMVIGEGHLRSFKPKDSAYETMEVVIDSVYFTGAKKEKDPDESQVPQADEFVFHEEDLPF